VKVVLLSPNQQMPTRGHQPEAAAMPINNRRGRIRRMMSFARRDSQRVRFRSLVTRDVA
jgi:hypothetical protein